MFHTQQSKRLLSMIGVIAFGLAACTQTPSTATAQSAAQSSAEKELASIKATQAQEQKNLANFDDLDFNVYSNQDWQGFHKSHAPDIPFSSTHLDVYKNQFPGYSAADWLQPDGMDDNFCPVRRHR